VSAGGTLNEEAATEAIRTWVKDRGQQEGAIARIFDKVRNAPIAIGSVLRDRGFTPANSIFGKITSGEVSTRRWPLANVRLWRKADIRPEATADMIPRQSRRGQDHDRCRATLHVTG